MRIFAETHGPAPSSPESLLPTEFALRLFTEAGLSDRDAVQAFHAFGGYIQGFVMMEAGSIEGAARRALRGRASRRGASPRSPPSAAYWAECDADEQFEFGLDLLIRGCRRRSPRSVTPSRRVAPALSPPVEHLERLRQILGVWSAVTIVRTLALPSPTVGIDDRGAEHALRRRAGGRTSASRSRRPVITGVIGRLGAPCRSPSRADPP
jgi:hypothetical protein